MCDEQRDRQTDVAEVTGESRMRNKAAMTDAQWQHHLRSYEWLTNDVLGLEEDRTCGALATILDYYVPAAQRMRVHALLEEYGAIKQAQVEVRITLE